MHRKMNLIRFIQIMAVVCITGCTSLESTKMQRLKAKQEAYDERWKSTREGVLSSDSPRELSFDEVEAVYGLSSSQMLDLIEGVILDLKKTRNIVSENEILFISSVMSVEDYAIHYRCKYPEQKLYFEAYLEGAIEHALVTHPSYNPKPYPRSCRATARFFRADFAKQGRGGLRAFLDERIVIARNDPRLCHRDVQVEVKSESDFTVSFIYNRKNEHVYLWPVVEEYFVSP